MSVPPLYARWLAEALPEALPSEPLATCDHCAMCSSSGDADEEFFSARTKCCTFFPDLPSFLVGRLLGDGSAEMAQGRARVEERIEAGAGVTPLGVLAPPQYRLQYRIAEPAFGRSTALRCPYYREEDGQCGIWLHRISTCCTWFCKHQRGAVGLRFWAALKELLRGVERALACWCLLELGFDPAALAECQAARREARKQLDAPSLDGHADHARQARIWGSWHGRERQLYEECGELVAGLSWRDVRTAGGATVALLERICVDAYQRHSDTQIPDHLQTDRMALVGVQAETARVATYSAYDPVEIPRAVLDLLHHFDGRPTMDVLEEIRTQKEVELEPELLRLLVDFEVLVDPHPKEKV